jgi:hypothetical protein
MESRQAGKGGGTGSATRRYTGHRQLPRSRLLPRSAAARRGRRAPRNDVRGCGPGIWPSYVGAGRLRKAIVQNKANLRMGGCVLTTCETKCYAIDVQSLQLEKQSQIVLVRSRRVTKACVETQNLASLRRLDGAGPKRAKQSQFAVGQRGGKLWCKRELGKKRAGSAYARTKPICPWACLWMGLAGTCVTGDGVCRSSQPSPSPAGLRLPPGCVGAGRGQCPASGGGKGLSKWAGTGMLSGSFGDEKPRLIALTGRWNESSGVVEAR